MSFTSLFDSLKSLVQEGVDKAVEEVDINVESVGVSNENQLLEAIDTGDTEIFITDSFALTH